MERASSAIRLLLIALRPRRDLVTMFRPPGVEKIRTTQLLVYVNHACAFRRENLLLISKSDNFRNLLERLVQETPLDFWPVLESLYINGSLKFEAAKAKKDEDKQAARQSQASRKIVASQTFKPTYNLSSKRLRNSGLVTSMNTKRNSSETLPFRSSPLVQPSCNLSSPSPTVSAPYHVRNRSSDTPVNYLP